MFPVNSYSYRRTHQEGCRIWKCKTIFWDPWTSWTAVHWDVAGVQERYVRHVLVIYGYLVERCFARVFLLICVWATWECFTLGRWCSIREVCEFLCDWWVPSGTVFGQAFPLRCLDRHTLGCCCSIREVREFLCDWWVPSGTVFNHVFPLRCLDRHTLGCCCSIREVREFLCDWWVPSGTVFD